jgi:hypothetical protein
MGAVVYTVGVLDYNKDQVLWVGGPGALCSLLVRGLQGGFPGLPGRDFLTHPR